MISEPTTHDLSRNAEQDRELLDMVFEDSRGFLWEMAESYQRLAEHYRKRAEAAEAQRDAAQQTIDKITHRELDLRFEMDRLAARVAELEDALQAVLALATSAVDDAVTLFVPESQEETDAMWAAKERQEVRRRAKSLLRKDRP